MRKFVFIVACFGNFVGLGQNINRLEYYFDTDPGFGNGIAIPISVAPDLTRDFTVPLNTVSEGFHMLYVRAKSNGLWSLPYSKPVFVQRNAQSNVTPPLKRVEFFIDTDPGFGNGTQLATSANDFDQLVVFDLSILQTGFHVLNIRSQDENGRWSQPYAKPFFVELSGSNIVTIEYYFDDGTLSTPIRTFTNFTPGKNLTIDFAVVLDGLLPNTTYTIHLTAINADGQRSTEVVHVFNTPAIICDPLTPPVTIGASRCESGTITLSATGASTLQQYHWYVNDTDLVPISGITGNSFTTPNLASSTTYYVAIVNGTCESSRTEVVATILSCNLPPEILTTEITVAAESVTAFELEPLLSDPNNNLDLSTLIINEAPAHAIASLNGTMLTLDYSNSDFIGMETLQVEVCDQLASCTQQTLYVKVVGELEIFNAVSPNQDLKNEIFYIQYIDVLPNTKKNQVSIFNRWGALVFQIRDYNNQDRVFNGRAKNGNELPSGTYFYKLEFENHPTRTGYLILRR